ncbi:type IV pilus modification protein PilV [Variovorax sp. YR216]|uniref:type IV pilus modification protein PilV n=1 Tax=Variovorax sp. YR216 TaxID=1882828 RepID=UPI00089CC6E8|nr:type IV pilus modification protein PilV [Variovorax sp. YR216]SEA13526.1 type IV pilus assembly protein PilV [Variovorax sp. YR216]
MAPSRRRVAGFSLFEVLVSIVVLSLGLLGAVGMLTTSVRSMGESGAFTSAVNLVRELSEAVRINKNVSSRNDRAVNPYLLDDLKSTDALPGGLAGASCAGAGASCDAKALAAWDLRQWVARVRSTLPEARVAVCFDDGLLDDDGKSPTWDCSDGGHNLVVKLGWKPHVGSPEEMSPDAAPRVVMQLVLAHGDSGSGGP